MKIVKHMAGLVKKSIKNRKTKKAAVKRQNEIEDAYYKKRTADIKRRGL